VGRVHEAFDDKFFDWWAHQIPVIENYPYARIHFLRDHDMPMPFGEEHEEISTHILRLFYFFNFLNIILFMVMSKY
jgi:hypothetical protein